MYGFSVHELIKSYQISHSTLPGKIQSELPELIERSKPGASVKSELPEYIEGSKTGGRAYV